jgi:hypothetical protein
MRIPLYVFHVLWCVMAVVVIAIAVVHHGVIVPALRRAGRPTWHSVIGGSVFANLRTYRELCEREGRSLRWWRVCWGLHGVGAALLLAWLVLLELDA